MPTQISRTTKEKSKLSKEEWRAYTKTVWQIANVSDPDHPAVFPLEIPRRLIKLFSFYGETVLDPFAGTGTTAVAAIPLGRRAVCFDQNRDYTRIIAERCRPINGNAAMAQIVNGDSRKMIQLHSDSIGLVWCLRNNFTFAAMDFGRRLGASDEHIPQWICKERATTPPPKRHAALRVALKLAWGFVAQSVEYRWGYTPSLAPRPRPI